MPLPAALQARLKRRGIISTEPVKQPVEEQIDGEVIRKGCPNATNPYHECSDYCLQRWGAKGKAKIKKKNYKLQPLPPGWFKVPDLESGHEYYWNVHTNQVAWRHPHDPRAEITYPAAWLQKPEEPSKEKTDAEEDNDVDEKEDAKERESKDKEKKDDKDTTSKKMAKVKTGKHPSLMKAQKQREKLAPYRRGKGGKDDEPLDPMDPASYSDVGRGTWSTGLKEDSEVKTGVDTTANGPLYQQRPYPTPGEILRRNKKAKEDADED